MTDIWPKKSWGQVSCTYSDGDTSPMATIRNLSALVIYNTRVVYVASLSRGVSVGKQSQAAVIREKKAAVASFHSHWPTIHKYSSLDIGRPCLSEPQKGFANFQ